MSSIGGYFELELPHGVEYHQNAIRLNTGRNAFEYVLKAKGYKKVYLPYYTCDVMLDTIQKLKLSYEFYHIDKSLFPIFDFTKIFKNEVFVHTNYFGICDKQVKKVVNQCKNVIVDNSQAFFSTPSKGVDTFYSARKFFGVPDGAYLYTDKKLEDDLKQDKSSTRFSHLLGRIEDGPEEHYLGFKGNDENLKNQPIKKMSVLTERILEGIDYRRVINKRRDNYMYLHRLLKKTNLLDVSIEKDIVPMVYPYFIKREGLRGYLLENKIFVAKYWPNVEDWAKKEFLEYEMPESLLPLPVDQRYELGDMQLIYDRIIDYGKEN